ncbi:hypothetical protein F5B21DRAFT_478936 [Xylaria acuta]|nr:hypothetical protein F5B21DRAFT_478936 [Xylaria acuta]
MGLTDGLLGPVLGGVLSFLGAIVAAIVAFALARLNRARPTDEERANPHNHELGHIPHYDRFHHRGLINSTEYIHHGQHRLIEYCRTLEVNVARTRGP